MSHDRLGVERTTSTRRPRRLVGAPNQPSVGRSLFVRAAVLCGSTAWLECGDDDGKVRSNKNLLLTTN
jgi:hypothetical protein